ncbi:DNA cytosine methyltransferase [Actinokineospora sp. UTMC 2448]|uniref:DNA cytosine methyltransferase n=1 Tax=Actinokineospora sp. UTMC 2448 TaxID=2268449 RepID=UPI002164B228|nr:DNA cytosine methyltransferase [Actinokineospora sp. UTMC 2448]UVS79885.1 Modification methylase HaeIII [Actinokineospora sp. UTMC 2448]
MIDLFAGCGGMTRGFVDAGFEPVLAVEHDRAAAATYAVNFGGAHVLPVDIARLAAGDVPQADVIIGGPPCQGFSNLGSRSVDDPRNQLWREYLRVVEHARPKVFVIENVDRFLSAPEFALLRAHTSGYELTTGHLLAADFGVPQRRKRAFVIGSRIGAIPLPSPTHDRAAWHGTETVLRGLPEQPATTRLPDSRIDFDGRPVPGVFKSADLHLGRTPTPLSLERYRHIPPGGGRFDLPDHLLPRCWREKRTGTTDVMGRMRWDHPSLTIRTEFYKPEKGQYLHPEHHRPITHQEAARLQTFPDDFGWCGTKIEIARQIGNAVPPLLAAAVAHHLRAHLTNTAPPTPPCPLC